MKLNNTFVSVLPAVSVAVHCEELCSPQRAAVKDSLLLPFRELTLNGRMAKVRLTKTLVYV